MKFQVLDDYSMSPYKKLSYLALNQKKCDQKVCSMIDPDQQPKAEPTGVGESILHVSKLKSVNDNMVDLDLLKNMEYNILIIDSPAIISSSSSNLKVKCVRFLITSDDVIIRGLDFEGSIVIREANNIEIERCRMTNGDTGSGGSIVCTNAKNVILKNIEITDSTAMGIFIESNSSVILNEVYIHDLSETLLATSGSKVDILKSTLSNSKKNGIHSISESEINISHSTISGTEFPAIYLIDSSLKFEENKVFDVQQNGITMNHSQGAVFLKNHIYNIQASAVSLGNDSKLDVIDNKFEKISGNSIFVSDGSYVLAKNNEMNEDSYPAVAILNDCSGIIISNKISNISKCGICLRGAADVVVKNNIITNVAECGVSISDTTMAVIKHNTIKNCVIAGVEVYNNSKCYILENQMIDVGNYGFIAYAGAEINAQYNFVQNAKCALAQMKWKGGGIVAHNKFQFCNKLFDGPTASTFCFEDNLHFENLTNDINKFAEDPQSFTYVEPYVENKPCLCLKCQSQPRNCFFQPCGHKVYCDHCAQELLDNHGSCPLCRFNVNSITTGFSPSEDQECLICSVNKPDCIIMPCGHLGFCLDCLKKWFLNNTICPYCRAEYAFYKKIITDI